MIDYVIREVEDKERIERLEIAGKIDSDHHPVVVWMKGSKEIKEEMRESKKGIKVKKIMWIEEGERKLEEEMKKWHRGEVEIRSVKEEWKTMRRKIEDILRKVRKIGKNREERKR